MQTDDSFSQDVLQRIMRLEAIEAIRQVKHDYFYYCDNKQPERVRQCFVDGPMDIEFGRIGSFESADALTAVFTELACAEHIVEMHHGQNPVIDVLDAERATGRWGLYYYLIDTRQQVATQLAGTYHDEYRCVDGQWKISATRYEVSSTQIVSLAEAQVNKIFAGRTAPASLDDPSQQAAG